MSTLAQLHDLYEPIHHELDQVRDSVSHFWADALALVNGTDTITAPVGGKLLRPALCLLSAGVSGAETVSGFIPMATAMEMFHLAALAHDDVIDRSSIRRGKASLNAMWSDHAAVLGGDYLVSRGLYLLTQYESCEVIRHAVECIRVMAEGELIEFGRTNLKPTHDRCIDLARAKTATLFGLACASPALRITPEWSPVLQHFGESLGAAFQLIDDLLDLYQEQEILGKPVCTDLLNGKHTLPILCLKETLSDSDLHRLENIRTNGNGRISHADQAWIHEILVHSGARERTEETARVFADDALTSLKRLPDNPYRSAMELVVHFVLERNW